MNKAELKAIYCMYTVMHIAQRESNDRWLFRVPWESITSSKLLLPLISNPLPHDSLAPVIPCWTESGTRVHGCHLCVFHLKQRWRFIVMVWCWKNCPAVIPWNTQTLHIYMVTIVKTSVNQCLTLSQSFMTHGINLFSGFHRIMTSTPCDPGLALQIKKNVTVE